MGARSGFSWKWVVLIGAFLSRAIAQGSIFTFGVFFDDIREFFRTRSTAEVALIFSLSQGLVDCTGIVAGLLLKKIEARYLVMAGGIISAAGFFLARYANELWQMIICLGVMNALGQGIARTLLPVAVSYCFEESQRHIAIALQNTGDGVGGLLFPLLYSALISSEGWRSALVITAGIVLHHVVAGVTIPPNLNKKQKHEASKASSSDSIEVPLLPNLIFMFVNLFTHCIGYATFLTFIYSDLTAHNVDATTASAMLSTVGAVSIIGRLAVGLMDNKLIPRWIIYAAGHIVRGAIVLMFPIASNYVHGDAVVPVYFLLCSLFGLTDGITGALICVVCLDVFGVKRIADVYSISMFGLGSGALVGVPVAGKLKDVFDSYDVAFIFSGCAFILAGLILVPFFFTRKHYELARSRRGSRKDRQIVEENIALGFTKKF